MVKHSKSNRPSFPRAVDEEKPVVAHKSQESTIKTVNTVALESLFPAHLKYIGISGKGYEWRQAGDVVAVDEEDVPKLLAKRIGNRGCCGVQSDGNVLFQIKEAV